MNRNLKEITLYNDLSKISNPFLEFVRKKESKMMNIQAVWRKKTVEWTPMKNENL